MIFFKYNITVCACHLNFRWVVTVKRIQYQCHASQDYAQIRENKYQDQEVSFASYILNIYGCKECAQSIKSHCCV